MKKLRIGFRHYFVAIASGILLLVAYTVSSLLAVVLAVSSLPAWAHWAALLIALSTALVAILGRQSLSGSLLQTPSDYMRTVRTLASAIDAGDPFMRGRSYRISKFCVRIGQHLGLSEKNSTDIESAALLHDIGRTAIHSDVLLKPGKLDDVEQAVVRTHPQIGYDILMEIPPLAAAAEIIFAHHEQPDGKGYPRGLSGQEIPVGSCIIQVVAAFDAMTCDRPYRRALSPGEAFEELRKCAGTQFSSEIVDALVELYTSGALFDGVDIEELQMYSSGHCVSRAVEEFLAERHIKIRGIGETGNRESLPRAEPDFEIAFPPSIGNVGGGSGESGGDNRAVAG